jgi:tetratricopeptide (TPR) repeat protein
VAAIEDRVDADVRLGRHGAVAGELTELVARYPLREGLRAQLALALYRGGRQAEALRALHEAGRTLRDELGVEPSRPLRDLEAQILAHDPELDPPAATPVEAPPAEPAAGVTNGRPPLIGRQGELEQLTALFDDTRRGGRVAVVEGEPGIGKTRLLEEVAGEAERRGAVVLWGRCHEGGLAPAFWPWLEVLRPLVQRLAETNGDDLPDLDQFLAPTAEPAPPGRDPVRFKVFEDVARTLARATSRQPVAVLVDDLQWADEASLELLSFLSGRLTAEPILFVAAVRELDVGRNDGVVDALATLTRRSGSRRLRLRGLDRDATGALLEQTAGRPVAGEVAAAVHVRAEGNPFYVTELARLLAVDAYDDAVIEVPTGVRDVVRRRLAHLPAATVELLRVAAVIGRDVDIPVLAQAAEMRIDECVDHLEPAVVQRLLIGSPGSTELRFSHALLREVLVDDVSRLRQARVHLRVADALETVGAVDDDTVGQLAEHLSAAAPIGAGLRAAAALERAAELAVRRSAYEVAEGLLERAVRLRRAGSVDPAELEAELLALHRLSAVRRARHGYARASAEVSLDRAKDLAHQVGRPDLYFALLWAEWAAASTAVDLVRAQAIVDQLDALVADSNDPVVQMIGHCVVGVHCWQTGRLTLAARHLDRFVEFRDQVPLAATGMPFEAEHRLVGSAFHLWVHDLVGDIDAVEQGFEFLAAVVDDPFATAVVQCFAAENAVAADDWERAERAARRGLAANPDIGFTFWGYGSQMFLAAALVNQGRIDEARELYEPARERYIESGVHTVLAMLDAQWARGLLRAGRVDEAAAAVARGRAELETHGERWAEPFVLVAEAELARTTGAGGAQVARLVGRALATAEGQGSYGVARRVSVAAEALGVAVG